jgi:hypothetical protein
MAGKMADAVIEGMQMREIDLADRVAQAPSAGVDEPVDELAQEKLDRAPRMEFDDFSAEEEGEAEDYLGPSVLQKIAEGRDVELPQAEALAEKAEDTVDAVDALDGPVADAAVADETADNA